MPSTTVPPLKREITPRPRLAAVLILLINFVTIAVIILSIIRVRELKQAVTQHYQDLANNADVFIDPRLMYPTRTFQLNFENSIQDQLNWLPLVLLLAILFLMLLTIVVHRANHVGNDSTVDVPERTQTFLTVLVIAATPFLWMYTSDDTGPKYDARESVNNRAAVEYVEARYGLHIDARTANDMNATTNLENATYLSDEGVPFQIVGQDNKKLVEIESSGDELPTVLED
ncbi:hypothetical protein [Kocuria palustris]|uniref:hypothetical protein n=1 Tax=Kocuria palustris TaxID=71999 RepID=UPI003CEFDFDB